jgi:hypothetical protein
LLHLGDIPEEIAEMQAVSIPTIYIRINRRRKSVAEELATIQCNGSLANVIADYERIVVGVVEK